MASDSKRYVLPFTAIVGQELMKKALLLNAINPRIGGVLIRGEKGTAKSTAVRALAELLPAIRVVKKCPFSCNPDDEREMCENCLAMRAKGNPLEYEERTVRVVDLPLGVTEDRLVGTIDIESAIKEGRKQIEPGILATVNRGILYIDEVNLLDDHIADVLLDSAALGVNVVEREGISFTHPARFILIGTMNPEEGEIRPQLLDRFGLQVSVEALSDPAQRIEIVRAAERFDANPAEFSSAVEPAQEELRQKILEAQALLPEVTISDELVETVVSACVEMGIATHRAEITIVRTAKTVAALSGRKEVNAADVREAMELALPHRMRRKPFEEPRLDPDQMDNALKKAEESLQRKQGEHHPEKQKKSRETPEESESKGNGGGEGNGRRQSTVTMQERIFSIGDPVDSDKIRPLQRRDRQKRRKLSGRRIETFANGPHGTYISSRMPQGPPDPALDATIRAAAPYQSARDHTACALVVKDSDIREKVRVGKVSSSCIFVVDASGSMGAQARMEAAKGAVLSLLLDSYRQRDRIGMVAFRGDTADLVLPLCSSVDLARKCLAQLPTGGKTPLSLGLAKGIEALLREQRKNRETIPVMVLISDGRANVSGEGNIRDEVLGVSDRIRECGIHLVVIDTEERKGSFVKLQLGFCREIAESSGGHYYQLGDLEPGAIRSIAANEIAGLCEAS
jgi:magnesium chelatase subunit D